MKEGRTVAIRIAFIVILVLAAASFTRVFPQTDAKLQRWYRRTVYQIQNKLPDWIWAEKETDLPLAVPFHKQEHQLTCETAALRMALNYVGIPVTEDELLENLTFSTRESMRKGIWGDPEEGFVGNVNGSVFNGTGYGVYDKPIYDLALRYNRAEIIDDQNLETVLDQVSKGNPVIAWGLLSKRPPKVWKTSAGKKISVLPGEHARVVIGYTGEKDNPDHIILMDPLYGKIRMSKNEFLSGWKALNYRAVVIYD